MSSTSMPKSVLLLAMLVVPLAVWATLVTLLVPGVYGPDVNTSILNQGIGQDLVTLVFAIPLTFVSLVLTFHGSTRGYLLLLGQLMYFAYTYFSATVLYPPNPMFPVHVVIYSAAFFGLARGLLSLDAGSLRESFSDKLPRRTIAGYLIFTGMAIGLLWVGSYVVPMLTPGMVSADILGEQGPNLVIQAMDLGLIVPLGVLSGILLWGGQPWGYALSGVLLVKAATMLLAILVMMVMMTRGGETVPVAQTVLFSLLAVAGLVLLGLFLTAVKPVTDE